MLNKLFGSPKNHSFNQALEHFQNLRYYESGTVQYVDTVLEIIRLCQIAIQDNKNDGDAHVLLANAYLLATLSSAFGKGYSFFLAKAASVIQPTRARSMYIKNRENADKVYQGIVEQLSTQMPDWVEGVERLPKDMDQLQRAYSHSAIDPLSLDEIKTMLTSE
jgi:hypothetical protein